MQFHIFLNSALVLLILISSIPVGILAFIQGWKTFRGLVLLLLAIALFIFGVLLICNL